MKRNWLAIGIILLFIGVSFQPIIAENTVSVEKESNFNNVDFDEAKEYLFQTIIDISNDPEVKGLLKQNNHKIFTSDYDHNSIFSQLFSEKPRLLKFILFTIPKMTYKYLEKSYNNGIEIFNKIGVEESSKIVESVKIAIPEIFNNLQNIILNDKDLSDKISILKEMNNEKISIIDGRDWETPIICFIISILFISTYILWVPFAKIDTFLDEKFGAWVADFFYVFYLPLEGLLITFLYFGYIGCGWVL